jgi:hypothetical protein
MQTQTRTRNGGANQQVLVKDGKRGEGDLEAKVIGQEMQILVEDVITLVIPEIVQKQV